MNKINKKILKLIADQNNGVTTDLDRVYNNFIEAEDIVLAPGNLISVNITVLD